jgi:hypothetical protein
MAEALVVAGPVPHRDCCRYFTQATDEAVDAMVPMLTALAIRDLYDHPSVLRERLVSAFVPESTGHSGDLRKIVRIKVGEDLAEPRLG